MSKHLTVLGSDSDEGPERNYSPEPGSSPPSKISTPARPQSQRAPRYQLNLGMYTEQLPVVSVRPNKCHCVVR